MIPLGFFFFLSIIVVVTSSISQCYPNQNDFSSACTTILHGVQDGGRCFFIGGSNKGWITGWSACEQFGAQLAQVHTEGEFQKIVTYLTAVLGPSLPGFALLGLYDAISPKAINTCVIDLKNSTWYDSINGPNPQLTAGNTWIRYHQCDGDIYAVNPPKLFVIYGSSAYQVGDSDESFVGHGYFNPLCQYNNPAQNFSITSFCLTENPVMTISTTQPNDCPQTCGQYGWCRGYNYITMTVTSVMCQLFSWSVYDTCPKCASKVAANASCTYYNYVA